MVVAERQAGRRLDAVGVEVLADAVAQGFEGPEAGATTIDRDENGGGALGGPAGGGADIDE